MLLQQVLLKCYHIILTFVVQLVVRRVQLVHLRTLCYTGHALPGVPATVRQTVHQFSLHGSIPDPARELTTNDKLTHSLFLTRRRFGASLDTAFVFVLLW